MKKRHFITLLAIAAFILPLFAEDLENLNQRLQTLRHELQRDYQQMAVTKDRISDNYEIQHKKMVDIMKQCNALSLRLYSQKQEYTLDLCYALEKVRNEFEDFNKDRTPYDRIVTNLDIEIDRYARLIESLRRLPPEKEEVKNLPDSLAYHNDSLEMHLMLNPDNRINLEIEAQNMNDSVASLFILDENGQRNRDTCLYYATELLKMYAESRDIIVSDSIHYQEAYLRLKESYDYARQYYKVLQSHIFIEGQTPWPTILADPKRYWDNAVSDVKTKYDLFFTYSNRDSITNTDSTAPIDTLHAPLKPILPSATPDTIAASTIPTDTIAKSSSEDPFDNFLYHIDWEHSILLFMVAFMIIGLLISWLVSFLLLWPVFRFVKPLKKNVSTEHRRAYILLFAILLFVLFNNLMNFNGDMFGKAAQLTNTFMWLLAAILTALLIRVKPEQLKKSIRIYQPTIILALAVIGFRSIFAPNTLMNFIFPPLLIVFFLWQLFACFHYGRQAERSDRIMGWSTLAFTGFALLASIAGYIFAALLILIWWYFQLATIHTMTTIWHLTVRYKEKRMKRRINSYSNRITYVSGSDKEALLFGATWFYDLVKEVVLPVLALMSLPFCIHLALNVFDFDDLYETLYYRPFYQFITPEGNATFRISFYAIILLSGLVFVFRYINKALHVLWRQSRYFLFMRKNNRTNIRKNEINLSLGNSIISVLIWMTYAIIVIITLQIPTGSLGLVAGGFSAGVGLALKDIINNAIYGVQLLTGRLKIGDWIECDGIHGVVADINYQSTQVETVNGTTVSFLNATLFAKNFTNLTKSNSYECLKLHVSVAYGTEFQRVRDVLVEAMQVMRTKDVYGREVVEPKRGIYVVLGEFGDSGVDVVVKQYILAAERIGYIDRAKEVIYNALNANGITIPFPQRDIHIIPEEG